MNRSPTSSATPTILLNTNDVVQRAKTVMPGGVSSPVRALHAIEEAPPVFVRGAGAMVWDEDGAAYVDLQMAFGPLILGHGHPAVRAAAEQALANGMHFGALHPHEVNLAERIRDLHPSVDMVRFVTSGTEAVMSAIRLARAATGRDLVVKFEGGYHGHADALMAKAGSGLATHGIADTPGTPSGAVQDTITLPFDDEAALENLFATHGDRIACILVEGIPANSGLLPQRHEWHARARRLTRDAGALLIVDEVITGFRLAAGGATETLSLEPDLVTFGKIIGGGLPVGAYGGRADLMDMVAPQGPVYQAGTLAGSPVALAAGLATLDVLMSNPDAYAELEEQGARLARALRDVVSDRGAPWRIAQVSSLLWFCPDSAAPERAAATLDAAARERYAALHRAMRAKGIWMPPSPFEIAFLSTAHDPDALDAIVTRFDDTLREASP